LNLQGQVFNYVNNPGFEVLNFPYSNQNGCKEWTAIDSGKTSYIVFTTSLQYSIATAPYMPTGFQQPRNGANLVLTEFYCDYSSCTNSNSRAYLKNRLKTPLKVNKKYYAKYYIVNTNNSTVGIGNYGIYVANSNLDTVSYCVMPLPYLSPQVEYNGSVIKDTLIWVPISGTFVANGTEKYLVLGNFKSNSNTNTLVINPTFLPTLSHDLYIDDVSLIECDQPAYAGPDKGCIPGDSVFIGSPPDVGIDEISVWYKLPSSMPIATVAGLWVKPVVTTTYVVRQDLCGTIKWDTVVVYQDAVGLEKLRIMENDLQVFPVPAADILELRINDRTLFKERSKVVFYNNMGQLVREEELRFSDSTADINVSYLSDGMYLMLLSNGTLTVKKKIVIAR
jgi:hypothetical protein